METRGLRVTEIGKPLLRNEGTPRSYAGSCPPAAIRLLMQNKLPMLSSWDTDVLRLAEQSLGCKSQTRLGLSAASANLDKAF
jgi:hypothetical protein